MGSALLTLAVLATTALRAIDKAVPENLDVHCIADNLARLCGRINGTRH